MVRVLHSLLLCLYKKFGILQKNSRVWDYLMFWASALFMWSIYFLNPGYKPITILFDKYANYPSDFELAQAKFIRNSTRIV
jgi:hypothetical protein